MTFRFSAEPWRWQARSDSWFFVSLPEHVSAEIADIPRPPSGFGAVRVRVRIGSTTWSTSVFPDAGRGRYVLPLKKAVRTAEALEEGVPTTVELDLE